MGKKRTLDVVFPLGGLNRATATNTQPPYATPDCLNVRPFDPFEGRERGGSRPGLVRSHLDRMGSGDPVRMLHNMTLAHGGSGSIHSAWADTFEGDALADVWTTAAWETNSPKVLADMTAAVSSDVESAAVVRDTLPMDVTEPYEIGLYIFPWEAAHHGKYSIFARLDDTTPDITSDGIKAELVMEDDTGAYSGSLTIRTGGVESVFAFTTGTDDEPTAGWFTVAVSGNVVTCYWRGQELCSEIIDAQDGTRVGFGIECTQEDGLCLVGTFRAQYYADASDATAQSRELLVGSAEGDLYREEFAGRLEQVTTDLTLRNGVALDSVQIGQELVIADYGDLRAAGNDGSIDSTGLQLSATGVSDWTVLGIDVNTDVVIVSNGTGSVDDQTYEIASIAAGYVELASSAGGTGDCSYRIERALKKYIPLTDTLEVLTATAGQVPSGNPIACRFNNRLVLAGGAIAPHAWYMSRQGDVEDWDYSQGDAQAAVAGTTSEAGVPGAPITALAPHSDDYLIFGCRNSLWRMRGDPAFGGRLDVVSHEVGIVDRHAWCYGPAGELVFLSADGVYLLGPGGSGVPKELSRDTLPRELLNVTPEAAKVSMIYDARDRGIHIYLYSLSSQGLKHWWLDWKRATFWPVALSDLSEPFVVCKCRGASSFDSDVVLGCRDGYLRRFNSLSETDDGDTYDSYVMLAPLPLGNTESDGKLMRMDGVMARRSGPVTWMVATGDYYEELLYAETSGIGTWEAGRNHTVRPQGRGQVWGLYVQGPGNRHWSFENIHAAVMSGGRRRL